MVAALFIGGYYDSTFGEVSPALNFVNMVVPGQPEFTIHDSGKPTRSVLDVEVYRRLHLRGVPPESALANLAVYALDGEIVTLRRLGQARHDALARQRDQGMIAEEHNRALKAARAEWDALPLVDGRGVQGLRSENYRRRDLSDGTVQYVPERNRP